MMSAGTLHGSAALLRVLLLRYLLRVLQLGVDLGVRVDDITIRRADLLILWIDCIFAIILVLLVVLDYVLEVRIRVGHAVHEEGLLLLLGGLVCRGIRRHSSVVVPLRRRGHSDAIRVLLVQTRL